MQGVGVLFEVQFGTLGGFRGGGVFGIDLGFAGEIVPIGDFAVAVAGETAFVLDFRIRNVRRPGCSATK